MPTIRTVLFDLDGTLIDSLRLILDSYHHTLAQHGLPARTDADWLKGVGTPLTVQLAEWRDQRGTIEAMIATYREYNLKHHDRMVTVYPGVLDAVRTIRASGRQTGLVTSKNRHGALRGLTLVGLEALMDVLVCADEVTNPKPHPEPVQKAVSSPRRRSRQHAVCGRQRARHACGPGGRGLDRRGAVGAVSASPPPGSRPRLLAGEAGGSGGAGDR